MSDTIKIRDDILLAALDDVVFDGWRWDMVFTAAARAGYSANSVRAVFPAQMIDVLDHFADWADREMLIGLDAINPDDLRVRDRFVRHY